jgi:hypothetical protein
MLTSGGQETQGTNMRSSPFMNGVATRVDHDVANTWNPFFGVAIEDWMGWTYQAVPCHFGVLSIHLKNTKLYKPNTRCGRCPAAPLFYLSCLRGTSMPRKNTEARWGSVVPYCRGKGHSRLQWCWRIMNGVWTNHALLWNKTNETQDGEDQP